MPHKSKRKDKEEFYSWAIIILFMIFFVLSLIKAYELYLYKDYYKDVDVLRLLVTNIFVSLGGIFFIGVWRRIVRDASINAQDSQQDVELDYGLLYLSLAMLFWDFGIAYESFTLLQRESFESGNLWFDLNRLKFIDTLISSCNSAFLLISLRYFIHSSWLFEKLFKRIFKNFNKKKLPLYVTVWVVFVISLMFVSYKLDPSNELIDKSIGFNPPSIDAILLGFPTVFCLSVTLLQTFWERHLPEIGIIAVLILFFTLYVQFWKADNSLSFLRSTDYTQSFKFLIFTVYKPLLVMIFLALAASWTHERLEEEKKEVIKKNDELKSHEAQLEETNRKLNSEQQQVKILYNDLRVEKDKVKSANDDMSHNIKNNLLILSNHANDVLKVLKNIKNDSNKISNIDVATEMLTRYKDLLEIYKLLYDSEEERKSSQFFEDLTSLTKKVLNFKDNEFDSDIEITDDLNLSITKKKDFGIIIYEMVTNARKHSGDNVKVNVQMSIETSEEKEWLLISIKDRGPEFFDIQKAEQENRLRGLKSIIGRIKHNDGQYWTERNFPGTDFRIKFPL